MTGYLEFLEAKAFIALFSVVWLTVGIAISAWFLHRFWFVIGCNDEGQPEPLTLRFVIYIAIIFVFAAIVWPSSLGDIINDKRQK